MKRIVNAVAFTACLLQHCHAFVNVPVDLVDLLHPGSHENESKSKSIVAAVALTAATAVAAANAIPVTVASTATDPHTPQIIQKSSIKK